ncbi:MAG: glycosyltransferase family 39 protein, partial [Acidobacteriota bacterium]|nr:glycosyltransferase family 39 protein [Acidobacteriota bacterium]
MTGRLRRAVARLRWDLLAIVIVAFAVRLGYRLALGEAAFLDHGYTFYRDIAESFLRGQGLCFDGGVDCAVRVPVYPVLVSFFVQWDVVYPGLPITQAAISASRCLIAYGIGRTLFGPRAGLVAAGLTAINPYSIVHSTAMQDTSLFNMLMALAIYLLLQSREPQARTGLSLAAGAALAVASLTTVRLVVFLPMAVLWAALPSRPAAPWRRRQAALVSIPIVLLLGAWVGRNWTMVGAPVLTTEAGESLWLANHPATAEFLPERSVDELSEVANERLPDDRERLLDSLDSEVATDRLLARWAIEYMWANPGQTLTNMGSKIAAAFSGQLSPARGGWVQLGYAAFIVPLHALALIGWWRTRGRP